MAVSRYQIKAYDPNSSWDQIAFLSDEGGFGQFSFADTINAPGNYSLHVPFFQDSALKPYLTTDLLFVFERQIQTLQGVVLKDWNPVFYGLHRTPTYQNDPVNSWYVKSFGFDPTEFLRRRHILYYAGTANAEKSGPGETVMKAFVDENIGPSALVSNGRLLVDGNMSGFTVESDAGNGDNWEGAKAYQELLDVVQVIQKSTGVDFRVVTTSPGNWEFQVAHPYWGKDRSTNGLDRSTGLNGAGNEPIIFSTQDGTLANVSYSTNRSDEENTLAILGQGKNSNRQVGLVENTTWQNDSSINQREGSINATGEGRYDSYVNSSEGNALLKDRGPQETLSFDLVQSAGHYWGYDYNTGDVIQIKIPELGFDFAAQIERVEVTYDDKQEELTHEIREL